MELNANPQPTQSNLDASFDGLVKSAPAVDRQPIRTLASRMNSDGKPETFVPKDIVELRNNAVSIAVMFDSYADREKALQLALSRKTALGFLGEPQEGATSGRDGNPIYYFRIWKSAPMSQTVDKLFG